MSVRELSLHQVTNHNGVGLAGGGRGSGEGQSRVLTENAESAQMRGSFPKIYIVFCAVICVMLLINKKLRPEK